jgi:opacity protein-like surface antigen
MGSLKALLIAGAVATGAVSVAGAADLPPPPLAPTIPPVQADYGGWYIRGDVGVGHASLDRFESNLASSTPGFSYDESHLDDSAFVGAGIGYEFNSWIRFDVTGEYRTSQRFQAIESYNVGAFFTPPDASRASDTYNGSIQSAVFLANVYLQAGNFYGFTPYVGGGAGMSYNTVASLTDVGAGSTAAGGVGNGGLGFAPSNSKASFAWAAMAGVSYDITPNVKLDIGYRYLDMGDAVSGTIVCTIQCTGERHKYRLSSNDIRIGLRWMFNAPPQLAQIPVAYEPPPPLVRKY